MDKIQNLQTQINATQAQINDYKTNPKYYDYLTYCGGCYIPLDSSFDCTYYTNQNCGNLDMFYEVEFFTKVRELANAESSLNSLQNQLNSTQAELALLQDKQAQIQATLTQANAKSIPTPPPPTQITSSIKVLQEIKSLQNILAHDTANHTSHSKNA